jgi:hypothetical protein
MPGSLPTVRSSLGQDIDRAAQPVFTGALPRGWPPHVIDGSQDYGIDYFVEIIESFAPTGTRFAVQVKGIDQPTIIDGAAIHLALPTKNLGTYLLTESLPVFLVVADVTTKRAYFLFVQRFADEQLRDEDWRDQQTVTVKVPIANLVSDHETLRRAAVEAHQYMLAVRSSPSLALRLRSRAMERLDRRCIVSATSTEAGEVYEIRAKETVRFSMGVGGLDAERRTLLRRGYAVPVAPGEVTFQNLPIMEHFAPQITGVQIAARVECTATVEIKRDGVTARLINMPTKVVAGIDEIRIAAGYTNAPMDVNVTLSLLEPKRGNQAVVAVEVLQAIDARWFGQRIDRLAHFDGIVAFEKVAAAPYRFRMLLHIPGRDEDFEVPWGSSINAEASGRVEFERAIAALVLARDTSRLLGVYPPLPMNALAGGLGDVELIHNLLTNGGHEGDGGAATFDGRTPKWSDHIEQLSKAKKRLIDFDANTGGNECFWNFLGEQVGVPVDHIWISQARCTVTKLRDGTFKVLAVGSKSSRFWVRRLPEPTNASAAPGAVLP